MPTDHHVRGRRGLSSVVKVPEPALALTGFSLSVPWEFLQSPLYADWQREWTYLVWTRLHCAAGDVLILLGAFWGTALLFRSRSWWVPSRLPRTATFMFLGLAYTMWSEWFNVNIRESWGYAAAMPVLFGIGLTPIVQWIALPPLTLCMMRWVCAGRRVPGLMPQDRANVRDWR